jgi:hypothetical protein
MGKLDALRKLIREELRAVIKEELPKILNEGKRSPATSYKNSILESRGKESNIPGTLNVERKPVVPKFAKDNPMAAFLNDTANSLVNSQELQYFDSSEKDGYALMNEVSENREVGVAPNVSSMLASSRPSSAVEMVQINEVPDFTGLMSKLMSKGVI